MKNLSRIGVSGLVAMAFVLPTPLAFAQTTGLTSGQIQAIISLVRSFGGDDAVVQNVSSALYGQTPAAVTSMLSNAPYLESIFPAGGPVGTTVDLVGTNLAGFEGDLNAIIVNSKGESGILYSGGAYYPTLYKNIYPGKEVIRVRIPEKACTVDTSYSGKACPSYIGITPGAYALYASPWGKTSNRMHFTVTATADSPQPSLKYDIPLVSPSNVGEAWKLGENRIIRWNYPTELIGKMVQLSVSLTTPGELASWIIYKGIQSVSVNVPSGGDVSWALLSTSAKLPSAFGEYTIVISAYDPSTGITHKGVSGILNVDSGRLSTLQLKSLFALSSASPSVDSRGTLTLHYKIRSDALSAKLYISCPTGVSLPFGTGGSENCNTWTYWKPPFPSSSSFTAVNITSQPQLIAATLYQYLPANPDYAESVSAQVTIQPLQ